jgi:hypothetical protein
MAKFHIVSAVTQQTQRITLHQPTQFAFATTEWSAHRSTCADNSKHVFSAECIKHLAPSASLLLSHGSKFRFSTASAPQALLANLKDALIDTCTKAGKCNDYPIAAFAAYITHITNTIKPIFDAMNYDNDNNISNELGLPLDIVQEGTKEIRAIQCNFVITTVDKMSGSFVIICKKLYVSMAKSDLLKSTQGINTFNIINNEQALQNYLHKHTATPIINLPAHNTILAHPLNPKPHYNGREVLFTFPDDMIQCVGRITNFTPADEELRLDLCQVTLTNGQFRELEEHEVELCITAWQERCTALLVKHQLSLLDAQNIDPCCMYDRERSTYTKTIDHLAHYYLCAKLHKDVVAARGVSASNEIPMTSISQVIDYCLKPVIAELHEHWIETAVTLAHCEPQGSPIISRSADIRNRTPTYPNDTADFQYPGNSPNKPHRISVADFGTLYTCVTLKDVLRQCTNAIIIDFDRRRLRGHHSIRLL